MKLEKIVLGYSVRAEIVQLDAGWDIGIFGGCRSHVGAVTFAEPDGTIRTLERPGHRDSYVSLRWAEQLARLLGSPVCVRCGIHYDNATKSQLAQITAACEDMLQELIAALHTQTSMSAEPTGNP